MARRITYVGWGGVQREVLATHHLGHGVIRHDFKSGPRRAIWDIAMGYVSGFRLRDIAYFVLTRSLSERVSRWALDRERRLGLFTPDSRDIAIPEALEECVGVHIAGFTSVECPACDQRFDVAILAGRKPISDEEKEIAGEQLLTAPDLADLWAHIFTHEVDTEETR